jgi:ribonuclease HI
MKAATPHYLLFSESSRTSANGQWRFLLQPLDGGEQFEAADHEPNVAGERLELLAVVRGLEALDQPSRVTLVTPSKYVNRGLMFGLKEWRANAWQWEHFGEMVPVKNRDLWQRVDRALAFHRLECRTWRFDQPHTTARAPSAASAPPKRRPMQRLAAALARPWAAMNRLCEGPARRFGPWLAPAGPRCTVSP